MRVIKLVSPIQSVLAWSLKRTVVPSQVLEKQCSRETLCPHSEAWLAWLERSTTSTPPLSTGSTLCWSSMRFSRSSTTSSYSLVCRATSCPCPPASSGPSPPPSKDIATLSQSPLTLSRRTGSSSAWTLFGDHFFSQGVRRDLPQGVQHPPGGGQDRGDLPQLRGGGPDLLDGHGDQVNTAGA